MQVLCCPKWLADLPLVRGATRATQALTTGPKSSCRVQSHQSPPLLSSPMCYFSTSVAGGRREQLLWQCFHRSGNSGTQCRLGSERPELSVQKQLLNTQREKQTSSCKAPLQNSVLWAGITTSLHQPLLFAFKKSSNFACVPESSWRIRRDSKSISRLSSGKTMEA